MSEQGHPARIWLYLGAATLASAAYASMRPLYVQHLTQLGFEPQLVGAGTAILRFFSFLGAPLLGFLMDRLFGVRRATVVGLGVMAAGALLAVVPGAGLLAVGSLVMLTVGELFCRIGILVLIGDSYPAGTPARSSAFLLRHVGLNFSFIGLPVLSASLVFAGRGILVPALMATAITFCAFVMIALVNDRDESAPEPVRSGFGPVVLFSLLGLLTSVLNVAADHSASSAGRELGVASPGASALLQLLNPVVVVALGIPVALMWTSARSATVGRTTVWLSSVAFVVAAVMSLISAASARADEAVPMSVAIVNMLGAVVEVLVWPLSCALVSSAAPARWRATSMGSWIAISGVAYGFEAGRHAFATGGGWLVMIVLAALAMTGAAALVASRERLAAYVASFSAPDHARR